MRKSSRSAGTPPAGTDAAAEEPGAAEPLASDLAEVEAADVAHAEATRHGGGAVAEPDAEAIARLEREASEWKDRALRAAADLDNYRKRALREREESAARSQAEVVGRVVEVADDLARVAHLDPAATSAEALHEGMLAIERKFLKLLETSGVERVDPAGQPFDPRVHEAVSVLPAPAAAQDQTVAMVFQPGYLLRGTLLRPARVVVYQWSGASAPAGGAESGPADGAGGDAS